MRKILVYFIGIIILSGCAGTQSFEPVEINPEIDVCEICNMSIAHENYATEIISSEGDVFKFDDIGCMVEFLEKDKSLAKDKVAKQFVRDSETGEWLELKDAFHAFHPEFWTPMANGIVTFKDQERAESYMKEQGKGELYNYERFLKHQWSWKQ
ncbi:nitrous oxide reductase accessory protein NosL [Cytobacillus dafuensis]|uniref:Nitrous oxide reduction protein n=1 Tax=Cytobacillus dafuensis TaxID=1742359 RepID=A0A5B8Z1R2_CYTDA|nr:nitrous oxide reductase accessory protein NosL [Cytobacillus dafuensis]QED46781.1 nitrous oxide reduction protein [Cytobacillus dafuensis]